MSSTAVWQEVECGGYASDLSVWEELGAAAVGPMLELGCGAGRVALRLARAGREVWAVDRDPALVAELTAASRNLPLRAICADVRRLSLNRRFELILAPLQLIQILGGESGRAQALRASAAHLRRGGRFAAAIVDGRPDAAHGASPLPHVRERDGWVYSSLPLGIAMTGERLEVRRLRQVVSPDGRLREREHVERLDLVSAAGLEAEGSSAGLRPVWRREIPAADGHVDATVVVLEKS